MLLLGFIAQILECDYEHLGLEHYGRDSLQLEDELGLFTNVKQVILVET